MLIVAFIMTTQLFLNSLFLLQNGLGWNKSTWYAVQSHSLILVVECSM